MNQDVKLRLVNGALSHVLDDMLRDTATGAAGTVNAAYIGLVTASPAWSRTLQRTDQTEASFSGYARQLVVWDTKKLDNDGRYSVVGAGLDFIPSDAVTPQTIVGVGLYSALTNGTLLGYAPLPTPIPMNVATDRATIVPKVAVPADGAPDWGIGVSVS